MKKLICLLITVCFFSCGQKDQTQTWNEEHIKKAFEFIKKNGKSKDKYGKVLPSDALRVVLPQNRIISYWGNSVLEVEWGGKSFAFFVDEPTNFKANLINGKYVISIKHEELLQAIKIAEEILKEVSEAKTKPETELLESTEPSALLVKKISEFVEKNSNTESYLGKQFRLDDGYIIIYKEFGKLDIILNISDKQEYINFLLERGPEYNTFRSCTECQKVTLTPEKLEEKLLSIVKKFGIE